MIQKIAKDDIEGSRYPDSETKRMIWDFALADKINEIIDVIDKESTLDPCTLR